MRRVGAVPDYAVLGRPAEGASVDRNRRGSHRQSHHASHAGAAVSRAAAIGLGALPGFCLVGGGALCGGAFCRGAGCILGLFKAVSVRAEIVSLSAQDGDSDDIETAGAGLHSGQLAARICGDFCVAGIISLLRRARGQAAQQKSASREAGNGMCGCHALAITILAPQAKRNS